MLKKVPLIAVVISLCGLLAEFTSLIELSGEEQTISSGIRTLLNSFNFVFPQVDSLQHYTPGGQISYVNVALFILLLLGAWFYKITDGREMRLIRFAISVMFIGNAVFVPSLLSTLPHADFMSRVFWGLFIVQCCGLVYLAWRMLTVLASEKVIAITTNTDNPDHKVFLSASKWQRLTHVVLDVIICAGVFVQIPLSAGLLDFFSQLSGIVGEVAVYYIAMVICLFLYYTLFELLFETTPGKLLTETRVVDEHGNVPANGAIMKRTLARFIPLEPISFFARGWHDQLSGTQVVGEIRSGFKMRWIVLILGFFLLRMALKIYAFDN